MKNRTLVHINFALIFCLIGVTDLLAQADPGGPGDREDRERMIADRQRRAEMKWNQDYPPVKQELDRLNKTLKDKQNENELVLKTIAISRNSNELLKTKLKQQRAVNDKNEAELYAKAFCACKDYKIEEQIRLDSLLTEYTTQIISRDDLLARFEELFVEETDYYFCFYANILEYNLFDVASLSIKNDKKIMMSIEANCEESIVLLENDINLMLRYIKVVWPETASEFQEFDLSLKFQ